MLDPVALDISWLTGRHEASRSWATSTRPGIQILSLSSSYVRVRVAGEGSVTVLFVTDPPNVVEQYDPLFAELSSVGRVACMEQPGFGFSFPKPGFDFTRPAFARLLEETLEALGPGPYVLVLACTSAFYGLEVAERLGARVKGLVIVQAAAWGQALPWARYVAWAFTAATLWIPLGGASLMKTPYLGQRLMRRIAPTFCQKTTPQVVRTKELVSTFLEPQSEAVAHGACNCMTSYYQRFFRETTLPVGVLDQPGLIVWGQKDPSHRKVDLRGETPGLRQHFRRSELLKLEGTGHHAELERPAAVARSIRTLLGSVV